LQTLRGVQDAEAVVAGTAPPERAFSGHTGGAIQDDAFRVSIWAPLLRLAGIDAVLVRPSTDPARSATQIYRRPASSGSGR